MLITSTDICVMCSKLAALSSNQANLQNSDFLSFANISMMTLAGEIVNAHEEYLVYQEALPVVIGQANYRIPYRALNGVVRHLWFEDSTGTRHRLYGREIENVEHYARDSVGVPDAFYCQGNSVYLLPTPNVGGTLVIAYPFRPNSLVETSGCQSIANVGIDNVQVGNIPVGFSSNALYDIIDHRSGNGIIAYDLLGRISGNSVYFSAPLPPGVQVGNWLTLATQSPVPMVPEEAHTLLLELAVMRVEMVRGNPARIKNSSALVADARKAFDLLLNNRIISKPHAAGTGGAQYPIRPW